MPNALTFWARWRAARRRAARRRQSIMPDHLFRRFFDLIGRLERPMPGLETKSEPERTLRITRLDENATRKP